MTDKTSDSEALEALEEIVEYAAHNQGGIAFRDIMDLAEVVRTALAKETNRKI